MFSCRICGTTLPRASGSRRREIRRTATWRPMPYSLLRRRLVGRRRSLPPHRLRHETIRRVNRMTTKARVLTTELFRLLHADTSLLPDDWRARAGEPGMPRAATIVGDYIAGMTDRYAMDEHRRLTDLSVSG